MKLMMKKSSSTPITSFVFGKRAVQLASKYTLTKLSAPSTSENLPSGSPNTLIALSKERKTMNTTSDYLADLREVIAMQSQILSMKDEIIATKNDTIAALKESLAKNKSLYDDIEKLVVENEDLADRINRQAVTIVAKNTQIAELESKLATNSKNVASVMDQVTVVLNKNAELTSVVRSQEEKIAEYKNEIERITKLLDQYERALAFQFCPLNFR
jgi:chromosome segregation ATPase